MIRWIVLSWWISTGYRAPLLRAALGIFASALATVALLSLGEGTRSAVLDQLTTDGGALRVKPPSLSLGALDLTGSVVPGKSLDEAAIRDLARLDGVAEVWPEAWSRFPVGLEGELLGQRLYSDGALLGVVAAGVTHDAPKWSWSPGERVPVLAPAMLLAVFNGSFAPANGLPRIKERAVVGQRFRIVAGRSSFARVDAAPVVLDAEIVGVTRYGGSLAGIVPIEVITWLDERLRVDGSPYGSAMVRLTPGANVEGVTSKVRDLGWSVEELGETARRMADAIRTVNAAAGLVGVGVAAVALATLSQVFGVLLAQRRSDLKVARSAGIGRGALGALLLFELGGAAGFAGVTGAVAGGLGAWLGAGAVANQLTEWTGLEIALTVTPSPLVMLAVGVGATALAVVFALPGVVRELARGVVE